MVGGPVVATFCWGKGDGSLTDGITIGPLSGCGLKRRYVPGRPKDGKWGKVGG